MLKGKKLFSFQRIWQRQKVWRPKRVAKRAKTASNRNKNKYGIYFYSFIYSFMEALK